MIVICEECGKSYRIDPSKIRGSEARFSCKHCGNQITAPVPPPAKISEKTAPPTSSKTDRVKSKPAYLSAPKIRFGLTAKLFIMMIIVSLVPLAMFWGITLKQTKNRIRYEARKNTNLQFLKAAQNIDRWFYDNARIIQLLAMTPDIISMDALKQGPLLDFVQQLHPEMTLLFTADLKGRPLTTTGGPPPHKAGTEKYLENIIKGKAFTWQTVFMNKPRKTALVMAVPITRANETIGLLAVLMTVDDIIRKLLTTDAGLFDFALLIRHKKRVIAHASTRYPPQSKNKYWQPLAAAFKNGKNGPLPFNDPAGQAVMGFVGKTAFGWGLAVQTEENKLLGLIEQIMSFAYLLLAITSGFVLIIAWFSGRALSRPIVKLTAAADRISVGDLDMEVRSRRKDEIGALAEAIARMQDSIRLSIERLRRRR